MRGSNYEIIKYKDSAYLVIKKIPEYLLEDYDKEYIDLLKGFYGCDLILRKNGLIWFVEKIQDVEFTEVKEIKKLKQKKKNERSKKTF